MTAGIRVRSTASQHVCPVRNATIFVNPFGPGNPRRLLEQRSSRVSGFPRHDRDRLTAYQADTADALAAFVPGLNRTGMRK